VELLNKSPNMNEEIARRKLLPGTKTTELRILRTLAYKIKCKPENELKKTELRLKGEY
jgi:hypothetical protein